jgi:hypothetical protein
LFAEQNTHHWLNQTSLFNEISWNCIKVSYIHSRIGNKVIFMFQELKRHDINHSLALPNLARHVTFTGSLEMRPGEPLSLLRLNTWNVGIVYLIHRAHLIGEMSKYVTIMEMYGWTPRVTNLSNLTWKFQPYI